MIWNEDAPVTVTNAMLHHACDYTPYEGMQLAAWPALTLCRGRPVYRDGALCGEAGYGAFQACERPARRAHAAAQPNSGADPLGPAPSGPNLTDDTRSALSAAGHTEESALDSDHDFTPRAGPAVRSDAVR